jgi:hypothetical protein
MRRNDVINRKRSLDIVAGKNGLEVTGSVLQYSLMSDCEIIPNRDIIPFVSIKYLNNIQYACLI